MDDITTGKILLFISYLLFCIIPCLVLYFDDYIPNKKFNENISPVIGTVMYNTIEEKHCYNYDIHKYVGCYDGWTHISYTVENITFNANVTTYESKDGDMYSNYDNLLKKINENYKEGNPFNLYYDINCPSQYYLKQRNSEQYLIACYCVFGIITIIDCIIIILTTDFDNCFINCFSCFLRREQLEHENNQQIQIVIGNGAVENNVEHKKIKSIHDVNNEFEIKYCVICMIKFHYHHESKKSITELSCKHVFHESCIENWFLKNNTHSCPICRCTCK